jgi:hypothetical protein
VDTFLTGDSLLRQKYRNAGIPDYEVRNIAVSEWLNYTRTFPRGTLTSSPASPARMRMTIQMDLVGGDAATTNQTPLTKLGRFVGPVARRATKWSLSRMTPAYTPLAGDV